MQVVSQSSDGITTFTRQVKGLDGPLTVTSERVLEALKANEDGDAELFADIHRGHLLYDHSDLSWYIWSEHYWREDLLDEAMAAVGAVIDRYGVEAKRQSGERVKDEKAGRKEEAERHAKIEEALLKRIRILQSVGRKKDILTLARVGCDSLGITGQEWDQKSWLLACSNGVINLRTGECRRGQPEDFIKTVAPVSWTGLHTKAPTWERFLNNTFNCNDDLIKYLQRVLGYSITGETTEHILCILWGNGRNGKGTLLETIRFVLDHLAGPIESEMILAQRNPRQSGTPTSDIMALRGKRLVWASETSEGRKLNPGKLKWLTGGDTLTGREVFGRHQVSFRPTHKFFLLTNWKPHAPAGDYALWARLHLVPFPLSFVDNPQEPHERKADPDLPEKLRAEASGILAWLVRGCLEWQRKGLQPPEAVKSATEEYRVEEDLIAQFISEVCIREEGSSTPMNQLWKAYLKWTEENGVGAINLKGFSRELQDRGFRRDDTGRTVFYHGIGIRSETYGE